MPRRLYLLRHGQTDANLSGIIQGQSSDDNPLNKEGLRQADFSAETLATTPISCIYTSPALRTKQTAEKIRKHHMPTVSITVLPDLLEINFGVFEGKTVKEIEDLYPDLAETYREKPSECIFPKGESIATALERVGRAVNTIIMNNTKNENILIVSHGGVMALIFVYLFGLDIDKIFQAIRHGNCGLSIIDLEGLILGKVTNKPRIVCMNDLSHLR